MKELTTMETNKAHLAVKPSALAAMAQRYSMDPSTLLNTLKNTVFKGATNEQLGALVVVSNEHGLNPFTREIYAFPDKSGGIQAVVGVDGWLRIINSNPNFDGVEFVQDDNKCTCILYVKGRSHPVRVTEYMDECARNTPPWQSHPKRMLRHKALIQAARIAFGFGGIRDEDDAVVTAHPASSTITVIETSSEEAQADAGNPEPQAEPDKPKRGKDATPQSALADAVLGAGKTFEQFMDWAVATGNAEEEKYGSFDELPADTCKRLLRAKAAWLHVLGTDEEAL